MEIKPEKDKQKYPNWATRNKLKCPKCKQLVEWNKPHRCKPVQSKNRKVYLLILMGMFLIGMVSAEECTHSLAYPAVQGSSINLTQVCDNCTYVNITKIVYPNQSFAFLGEGSMTKNGVNFYYPFSSTNSTGTYYYTTKGDLNGILTSQSICFDVTGSGRETTTGNALIIAIAVFFFLIIGILCFVGFLKSNKIQMKWTFILGSLMSFLAGVNLISALIPDALVKTSVVSFFDNFTAISFVMFWFAFGLIILMWAVTFLKTMFYNKLQRNLSKYG